MIKNILLGIDGSPYSKSSFGYAGWLTKGFNAKLTAIHVIDIVALEGPFFHDLSGSAGFEPFLNFSQKMRSALEASGKAILDSFKEDAASLGISGDAVLASGIVSNEICAHAKLSDLVIVGRRGVNARFEYGLLGSTTEGVIRKSPRPVLITPERFHAPKNPLLAYDGSPHAAKAMHSAAEFSKALSLPLTVLTVAKDPAGGNILKEAEDYLKPYAVKVNFVHIKDDPPSGIKRYYADNNHDLIFMGATHHTRLAEMVIGSTTEYVMRAVEGPFFLER